MALTCKVTQLPPQLSHLSGELIVDSACANGEPPLHGRASRCRLAMAVDLLGDRQMVVMHSHNDCQRCSHTHQASSPWTAHVPMVSLRHMAGHLVVA